MNSKYLNMLESQEGQDPHPDDAMRFQTPLLHSLMEQAFDEGIMVEITKPPLERGGSVIAKAIAYNPDNTHCVVIVDANGEHGLRGQRVLTLSCYDIRRSDYRNTGNFHGRKEVTTVPQAIQFIREFFQKDLSDYEG